MKNIAINPEDYTILAVDDIATNIMLLKAVLSRAKYKIVTASGGNEALKKAATELPDLILLDIMMPGMDGVSACAEIRRHSVAPILFLTAKAQPGDMSDAYGSGGDDYLVKPFSNHELFLRVDSLIRRYRVYHGKGDAPTVIDALEINRDKGTVCKKTAAPSR